MSQSGFFRHDFGPRAARALAVMWNTLDLSALEPLLARNVRYEPGFSIPPIEGKPRVLDYLASATTGRPTSYRALIEAFEDDPLGFGRSG